MKITDKKRKWRYNGYI